MHTYMFCLSCMALPLMFYTHFLDLDLLMYVQSNSTGNDHHTAVDIKAATQQGRRHEAAEATSSAASSSPAPPGPGVAARQTYPDIMDISGMDYSPSTRKPPIHN